MKPFVVLGILFICAVSAQNEDITCSPAYCDKWLGDNTCPELSEACRAQNSTHSGLIVPYPGICNCCDYCLTKILEGDACAIGNPSSPTPTQLCGDGLACDPDELVCKRINTACTRSQDEYEAKKLDGTLGHMEVRPDCDRNGLFSPYNCIPGQICYCLSEDGDRIFGEIEFSDGAASLLKCGCSRDYHTAVELIGQKLHPNQHFRCKSNGDYDQMQCIEDNCYCVNASDGSPAVSGAMSAVNITLISKETIDCFDEEYHKEGEYRHECETVYLEKLKEIQEMEEAEGYEVIGYTLPNCQLDGKYGPVQINSTMAFCSDPDGNVLEDFFLDLEDDLRNTMNCYCARARSIMTNADEKPACCKNGNYAAIQCRRGLCRCVDKNGNQIAQELHYSVQNNLPCYQEDETVCAS